MASNRLRLIGSGLATALAPTLVGTTAALAEGDAGLFRNERFLDAAFNPLLCAFREGSEIGNFADRCELLAKEALADLFARVPQANHAAISDADLIIVLPEISAEEGLHENSISSLAQQLIAVVENQFSEFGLARGGSVAMFPGGNAGVGYVLEQYQDKPGQPNALLVLAVDSYNDRMRLNALSEKGRLFSDQNKYGFVPGEAAGVLLVARDGEGRGLSAASRVETVKQLDEAQGTYPALASCCFAAIEKINHTDAPRIDAWHADWDNSRYRASELSLALLRVGTEYLADGVEPNYLSPSLGNLGAAYGATALALLAGDDAGSGAIVTAGSTLSGLRAAVLVELGSGQAA